MCDIRKCKYCRYRTTISRHDHVYCCNRLTEERGGTVCYWSCRHAADGKKCCRYFSGVGFRNFFRRLFDRDSW